MLNYETILSRDAFLLSVELRLFWLIAFAYGLAFILYAFHVVTRGIPAGKAARSIMWAAAFLHVCLIIFRTFEGGRAPFQTLYESLSWFACMTALVYLYISRDLKKVYLPGIFVSAVTTGVSLYALLSRSPSIDPISPALKSWWFEWHVIFAFFSYAVFTVSAAIEASHLIVKPFLTRGYDRCLGFTPGMMDKFHKKAHCLAAFGYPLFTFTVISGAAWANEAWGKYWSWDPKETWSLATWTVFTIYLHCMTLERFKGLPASVINLAGFACMLMTFLGVNWLAKLLGIPSLHVYAV